MRGARLSSLVVFVDWVPYRAPRKGRRRRPPREKRRARAARRDRRWRFDPAAEDGARG